MNYFTVAVTLTGNRICTSTEQFENDTPLGWIHYMLKKRALATHGKNVVQITVTQDNYQGSP